MGSAVFWDLTRRRVIPQKSADLIVVAAEASNQGYGKRDAMSVTGIVVTYIYTYVHACVRT
jgi:hypothetical protein